MHVCMYVCMYGCVYLCMIFMYACMLDEDLADEDVFKPRKKEKKRRDVNSKKKKDIAKGNIIIVNVRAV